MKVAVFVLADADSNEGLGRVVNAMTAVKELRESGHEARIYFDGTGTKWPKVLAKEDHIAHALYESIRSDVAGACLFCSTAFGAKASVLEHKVKLVDEFEQHVSIRKLLSEGFEILNF